MFYVGKVCLFFLIIQISTSETSRVFSSTNNPNGLDFYTQEEFMKIPLVRQHVKNILTQDYMFANRYLVRFLRTSNQIVKNAIEMIEDNMNWRKSENLENLVNENFTKWQSQFPFFFNRDLQGRPGIITSLRNMDLRKIVLTSNGEQFYRYILFTIENSNRLMPLYVNTTGKEMINGNLLINAAGFNSRSHLCFTCLPWWINLITSLQKYYPQASHRILIINLPKVGEILFKLTKPILNPYISQALKLFGVDKQEWLPQLFKIYPRNQLTREFGGNLPKNNWKDAWKLEFLKKVNTSELEMLPSYITQGKFTD